MGWDIWYSDEGPGWAAVLVVPNVTAHPSTASVLIILLLYDGSLLCGFNVAIKGLNLSELILFLLQDAMSSVSSV